MNEPTLTETDSERLNTQLNRVKMLMIGGEWKTLREIADHVQGSEAGVSARLRQLRNDYGYVVNRRKVNDRGLWEYQVLGSVPDIKFDSNGQAVFL